MLKTTCLIAEIFLGLLLIAGNAGALYLLKSQGADDKTVEADGNTVTLPDGTVFTAKKENAIFEFELKNGEKKTRCVSDGGQWHCTGIWNGKKYEIIDDGKEKFHWSFGNITVTDFNYDHLMDIKTDGDSQFIFTDGRWLKCWSWDLGEVKTARGADGKTYQWSGSAWQK